MGQDIYNTHFQRSDFDAFGRALELETALLAEWFAQGRFTDEREMAGFELEIWLVDHDCCPAPVNEQYIALAGDQPVVAELARFNIELNTSPQRLTGSLLSDLHRELGEYWGEGKRFAQQLDAELVMIGVLPTVEPSQLTLANMSPVKRYRALNEQILSLRGGAPLELDIEGEEHLQMRHGDVMLEAVATSFQIHRQIGAQQAVRFYNAAHILSAPMVAVSANSPYLFGHDLWDESRIPLFEQSVAVAGSNRGVCGGQGRVTFGSAYLNDSIHECFQRNRDCYPALLPVCLDEPSSLLPHLRLHNGTLWRWNRPLIGFDNAGVAHLRLEHRVVPAGPTIIDMVANAALFYGLLEVLARQAVAPEASLGFEQARGNFYRAAKQGLAAEVVWLGGKRVNVAELLRQLLPLARRGLRMLGMVPADINLYLGVIEGRLRTGQNGAAWQRAYIAKHGRDFFAMTRAYLERQECDQPVHEWGV